jgi:hypothetical protein
MLPAVMRRALLLFLLPLGLVACSGPERTPVPVTRPDERAGAAVVRTPLPDTQSSAPVIASAPPSLGVVPPTSRPDVTHPGDAIYVCVVDKPSGREQTVITFAPKVHGLCKRHPEMGPCQYERNQCRAAGGRVYARGGAEITLAHEAEYDKKVMRVRFRAN